MAQHDDPVSAAEVYAAYGRTAQARAVLEEAAERDPSKAAVYRQRAAELELHAKHPAARERQTQRYLMVGAAGFVGFVAGALLDLQWLEAAGIIVWVGCGIAAVLQRIRR